MFQTLSHVMEVDEETMSAATNSCEKILDAIERYTSRISLEPDRPVIMTTPNIAVETVLVSTKSDSYSFRPSFEGDPSTQLVDFGKKNEIDLFDNLKKNELKLKSDIVDGAERGVSKFG